MAKAQALVGLARVQAVRQGVHLEQLTVGWMVVEAVASVAAGIVAHSLLLVAFGLDSGIELVSGSILLWRLAVEARGEDAEQVVRAEQRAARVVAVALMLLCLYVVVTAFYGLITRSHPDGSLIGVAIAAAAVILMPLLGMTKRRLAARLESGALRGDAANAFTCGYMAATVLLGVGLNTLFHWWWAEPVAALLFLFWLVGETREALEEAGERCEDTRENV
jgi:divalent metal cation (Fe/Co/Zn/Cd) transporter